MGAGMATGRLSRWTRYFTVASAASLVVSQGVAVRGGTRSLVVAITVFGFVCPMIFGMAYLLLPSYVGRTLAHQRLPGVHLALAYLVALGVLTGGFVWKHLFVRPSDLGAEAADYCAEMYDRFDRIAAGAIAVLALSGTAVLWEYLGSLGRTAGVLGYAGLVSVWLAIAVVSTRRSAAVER